jgi:predicted alpha/beta-hydrolase family hydrolase
MLMRLSSFKVLRPFAALGLAALIAFAGWSFVAYRATPEARAALRGDDRIAVERGEGYWLFQPKSSASGVGLLFFPGALVDPVAYAPLTRDVAHHGYPVLLVELPWRGAFGAADWPDVLVRAHDAMRRAAAVHSWIVAGHSRGGGVAARLVFSDPSNIAGLVLIGSTHPRDFSLAHIPLPVTRVYGTRDTVADLDQLQQTRDNLPSSTRMVAIDGGNHSQFGYYGFQPGDSPATITRDTQQRLTRQALTDALEAVARRAVGTYTLSPASASEEPVVVPPADTADTRRRSDPRALVLPAR